MDVSRAKELMDSGLIAGGMIPKTMNLSLIHISLGVTGTCPENSLLYVALGAALYADKEFVLSDASV